MTDKTGLFNRENNTIQIYKIKLYRKLKNQLILENDLFIWRLKMKSMRALTLIFYTTVPILYIFICSRNLLVFISFIHRKISSGVQLCNTFFLKELLNYIEIYRFLYFQRGGYQFYSEFIIIPWFINLCGFCGGNKQI